MENVVIYYQQKKEEQIEFIIDSINKFICKLESEYAIKGVYIDNYYEETEFLELVQAPLSEIDYLYIDEHKIDDFAWQILNELSRTEKFKIRTFKV